MYHLLQILYDTQEQKPVVFAGFTIIPKGEIVVYYPDTMQCVYLDGREMPRFVHYHRKMDTSAIVVGDLVRTFGTEGQFFGMMKEEFFQSRATRVMIDVAVVLMGDAIPAKLAAQQDDDAFL